MLHLKVEVVPFGRENERHRICELFIANLGVDEWGVHKYGVSKNDLRIKGTIPSVVVSHNRDDGPWKLIQIALDEMESDDGR